MTKPRRQSQIYDCLVTVTRIFPAGSVRRRDTKRREGVDQTPASMVAEDNGASKILVGARKGRRETTWPPTVEALAR